MKWKTYSSALTGSHAFLAPSRYYWLNYDEDKLRDSFANHKRAALGSQYHSLAERLITMAVRLPDNGNAFNAYVNDAIGFSMKPEQLLFYSEYCYGTADAIHYDDAAGVLRIHDLKTGVTPGNIEQLMIYAALFVLDYGIRPSETILRIYQGEDVVEYTPELEEIQEIATKIVDADRLLTALASVPV